jgi:polysaccharide export outer membrane protein
MKKHKLLFLSSLLFLLVSCKAYKEVVYVQTAGTQVDLTQNREKGIPEAIIKKGDLLMITLSTISAEAAIPFNPPLVADPQQSASEPGRMSNSQTLMSYLVNVNGEINFPVLGKLKVNGLKKTELESLIRSSIYPRYIKEDPMVTVRFLNYKISVLGDVTRPGQIASINERISIFDALSASGDLTIYGKRKVLIIREDSEGNRNSYRVDLTDPNLLESPFYYLQQNDVVYVEPNSPRRRSSYFGTGESMTLGIVGTLLSVTSFMIAILR